MLCIERIFNGLTFNVELSIFYELGRIFCIYTIAITTSDNIKIKLSSEISSYSASKSWNVQCITFSLVLEHLRPYMQ